MTRILIALLVFIHFIWGFLFWFAGHILYRSFIYCEDTTLWGCSNNLFPWMTLLIGDYIFVVLSFSLITFIYDQKNGNLLTRTVGQVVNAIKKEPKNERKKKTKYV